MIGSHYIKSWSKNQSTIALSSAEAELYGIIKTSSETLGIMSILKDWNLPYKADIMADASAALGIIGRTGLGKLRHIDTSYLWLQQESIKKKLRLNKVKGTENPADMNTKGLSGDEISKYVRMLNMEHQEGRSELAPEVHSMLHKERCIRYNSTSSKVTRRVRINQDWSAHCSKTVLEQSDKSHVFEAAGCGGHDCGCHGCWMFCSSNGRS